MFRNGALSLIFVGSIALAFSAGEPFKPGKLPPSEQAALQQGLTLRFYERLDGKSLDARRVRLAALHVPANEPPSPFVAAGPFSARFSGYIKNPLKNMFSFRLNGTGTIVLKINDKTMLSLPSDRDKVAEIELAKNYNRIEILYTTPTKGDATMRLYWASDKFGFEPVSPEVLYARKDDADLVEKTQLREGRRLFADHHCASCHALPGKRELPDCKMPEMHGTGPRLDAGARFGYDWLVAWILNPRELRPEATMPRLLSGPDSVKKAADIASYLRSLKWEHTTNLGRVDAEEGEAVYKKYGCNSCHRLDHPKEKDELGRLSLHHVAAKFSFDALPEFLQSPHKRYAWIRMPDFRLTAKEAKQLEAFLRTNAKGSIDAQPKGDSGRGARLFQEVGCAHCHQVATEKQTFMLHVIKAVDQGCLAAKHLGKAADFALSDGQRAALTVFLKTDGSSLTRETPAEFSLRQVQSLQCTSCHRRDGESTRWHAVLEEIGKEPEKLPSLTWVGEKLKPEWTKKLLLGQYDHSARPWIRARMPAFPARAEMLAVGLSHEHGFGVNEDERPPHDAKLAEIGAKLIPQTGGFNCINCHGIGSKPPIAPFEAPGINLVDAALRLRFECYQRWMLAPDRVDVTMRMPVFAADGKTTQLREIFDGDARKQFGALWHYIQTLPGKQGK